MPLKTAKPGQGLLDKMLRGLGSWVVHSGKYIVLIIVLGLLILGSNYLNKVPIGNVVPGSEILWPYHRYNADNFRISFSMPLLNPLYVIVDTQESQGAAKGDFIREILQFMRYMQGTPNGRVMFVQSIIGPIPAMHRGVRQSDPNWSFLPDKEIQIVSLYRFLSFGGGGGRLVDMADQKINIIINCRDKTAQTIKEVIKRIKKFINEESKLAQTRVKYRLAGGTVGVQAAINETLTTYQLATFLLAIGGIFLFCTYIFQSFVGGVIVTIPLLLSNVLAFAFMVLNDPPLPITTATLPVSSVGIGLGVDYGIYLVSRIMEEYKNNGNLPDAISDAMGTTGKAIVYTGTTLLCGMVFWFLSKLMFQALMGQLLAIILTLNMLGALLIVPSLIALFKPKFIIGKNKSQTII
jgi:predicted RND superfamily exporter protein